MRTRLPLVAAVVASLALANGCGGGSSGSQPPPAADFSIAVQPSSLSLVLGMSGPIQVTVSPENGFSGTVAVDTNSLPTGVTVTPALPQSVGTSGLTLKVAAASAATAGTYTLTFVGSSGNLQHSANLSLALTTPAPETIPGNRTNWVRLGSNPIAVYYDAPRNHVLTSLPAINRVVVIDPITGSILSSIPVSVANSEPNGVWLASSSNISGTLDGKSLLVLGAGHVATIDLASVQVVQEQPLPIDPNAPMNATFLVAASGGHIILGRDGGFSFYNWDGISTTVLPHTLSSVCSFDRSFNGTKVLVASGDSSGAYQLLDVAGDTITAQGAYPGGWVMGVRGNPVRDEWAVANSNGIDSLDPNLNLVARVQAGLVGSITYSGMTYSPDGKYLYFGYSPNGLPFLMTVDATTRLWVPRLRRERILLTTGGQLIRNGLFNRLRRT